MPIERLIFFAGWLVLALLALQAAHAAATDTKK